ncbi:hypothetical protein TEQG_00861 [Trichophyton equinum CBS 127.97]|uniref:Uncharacterized protein n=1 Tax=Trichophyton equinum (strain ATCC MYA-4606 / CBS 127.97) TaxID=559882 RepID=F2PIU9_TRIEC|nr:hypothetical protein TEQG_00861 [Trichophyton equinum CBS 127.97]
MNWRNDRTGCIDVVVCRQCASEGVAKRPVVPRDSWRGSPRAGRGRRRPAGERLFRSVLDREDLGAAEGRRGCGREGDEEVKFGLAVVFSARLFFRCQKKDGEEGSSSGGRRIGLVSGA